MCKISSQKRHSFPYFIFISFCVDLFTCERICTLATALDLKEIANAETSKRYYTKKHPMPLKWNEIHANTVAHNFSTLHCTEITAFLIEIIEPWLNLNPIQTVDATPALRRIPHTHRPARYYKYLYTCFVQGQRVRARLEYDFHASCNSEPLYIYPSEKL